MLSNEVYSNAAMTPPPCPKDIYSHTRARRGAPKTIRTAVIDEAHSWHPFHLKGHKAFVDRGLEPSLVLRSLGGTTVR